jgi:hypothetical protein
MTAHDFQSMSPGTSLTFPYACGVQCRIGSLSPMGPGSMGGSITQSGNGFVGLAAGKILEVQFPPLTSTIAFRLWCGAATSRLEVYSSTGTLLATRHLMKGSLGNGIISLAMEGITRALLHHDNGEGLLLGMQWEGGRAIEPQIKLNRERETDDPIMQAAIAVFALTGTFRAAAALTADLSLARKAIAAAVMTGKPEFAVGLMVTPSREALELGTVDAVWRDCKEAAISASNTYRAKIATQIRQSLEGLHPTEALGPFEDISPGGRRNLFVLLEA